MSDNYVMIDGKRIDLSDETTENFKKQFGTTEPKRVKVMWFRTSKRKGRSYPYYLGSVSNHCYEVKDGETQNDSHAHISLYSETEVKQIIAGLQDLLKD